MTLHTAELTSRVCLTIVMFLKLTKCHSSSLRTEGGSRHWHTLHKYLQETLWRSLVCTIYVCYSFVRHGSQTGLDLTIQERITLNLVSSCLHFLIPGVGHYTWLMLDCLNIHSELLETAVTGTQTLCCVHTIFFSEPEVKLGEPRWSEVG